MAEPRFPASSTVSSSGAPARSGIQGWNPQMSNVQQFPPPNNGFHLGENTAHHPRSPFLGSPDGTAGLTKQMSNYNLYDPNNREVSPANHDNFSHQQPYGMLDPHPADHPASRNPELYYGNNVLKRAKATNALVSQFFKDSVVRARDRNMRYVHDHNPPSFEYTGYHILPSINPIQHFPTLSQIIHFISRKLLNLVCIADFVISKLCCLT